MSPKWLSASNSSLVLPVTVSPSTGVVLISSVLFPLRSHPVFASTAAAYINCFWAIRQVISRRSIIPSCISPSVTNEHVRRWSATNDGIKLTARSRSLYLIIPYSIRRTKTSNPLRLHAWILQLNIFFLFSATFSKLQNDCYFARGRGWEVVWWVCLSVCLSVRQDISGTTREIFTKFLCMLPVFVARSSSGMLTIGRTACRRESGDGSTQRGRSAIYDCLVDFVFVDDLQYFTDRSDVCLCVHTISLELNNLWSTFLARWFNTICIAFIGQGHRSKFKVTGKALQQLRFPTMAEKQT